MVLVLTVIIAVGVLGVIARLAVYSFVVVSFLYSCSLNLWCEALFLIKKIKIPENHAVHEIFVTLLNFSKASKIFCKYPRPKSGIYEYREYFELGVIVF